jgi:DNA replication ATP-dependent helicase Dna2
LYEETVGNMSEADTAFFRKWETLLTLEGQDLGRFKSQLWTMSAEEREQNGRYVSS